MPTDDELYRAYLAGDVSAFEAPRHPRGRLSRVPLPHGAQPRAALSPPP